MKEITEVRYEVFRQERNKAWRFIKEFKTVEGAKEYLGPLRLTLVSSYPRSWKIEEVVTKTKRRSVIWSL